VSGARVVQRAAERLIGAACRHLPADVRAERYQEWTAELPAILGDASIRFSCLRWLRALAFCLGIARTTRQLSRSARAGSRRIRNSQWRSGGPRTRPPDIAVRVAVGLGAYIVFVAGLITVLATHPDPRGWPFLLMLVLGIGFDVFCLADIARASEVRYLSKWQWVLICLIQVPLGGIAYLCLGRIGPARRLHPEETRS
jgi:hypothetical protein